MANKEKPRYDGTWRPEEGKVLPPVPEGVRPVLRFKTPQGGVVAWEDKCKGRIEFQNSELDDLVIARPDGTPTYNFCVCVDDMDMRSEEHTSELQSQSNLVCRLLLEKKKNTKEPRSESQGPCLHLQHTKNDRVTRTAHHQKKSSRHQQAHHRSRVLIQRELTAIPNVP